jgi:hypothetical protein
MISLYRLSLPCLLFTFIGSLASAQSTTSGPTTQASIPIRSPASAPSAVPPIVATQDGVQESLAILQVRTDEQIRSVNQRIDSEVKSTDEYLKIVGAVGAIIGIVFTIIMIFSVMWSYHRERERRQDNIDERKVYQERITRSEDLRQSDYAREREFRDQRALAMERLQAAATNTAIDLSVKADIRRAAIESQQLELGQQTIAHSEELLSKQIENVAKIGSVISLVTDTFALHLKTEKDQGEYVKKLAETTTTLDQFLRNYHQGFEDAASLIFAFRDVKGMDWPKLTLEDLEAAGRARTVMDFVLPFVRDREKRENPYRYAKILQLVGVSAYYVGNIDSAFKYLEESDATYKQFPVRQEDTKDRAYTAHFLGVASKNWELEGSPRLDEAKAYLQRAWEAIQTEDSQFLIPVTYAEVLSCRRTDRDEAKQLLGKLIGRLEQNIGSLNRNQRSLYIRSYLLLGNLAVKENNIGEAKRYYHEAKKLDNQLNPFVELSLVLCQEPQEAHTQKWEMALNCLEQSGLMQKRETTSRVMILAWAYLAAQRAGNHQRAEKYREDFEAMERNIRSFGHRKPLFFSPISKEPVEFTELRQELERFSKA